MARYIPFKKLLVQTVFREGAVRTVLWGPCRGIRYRIFPSYGWSYLYGGWERSQVRLMQKYIQPGSVAYDLGANYGMHTLLMNRLVGPSGKVFAFEPSPEVYTALQDQLSLNPGHRVQTVNRAVSEQTGFATFDPTSDRATGCLSDRGPVKVSVVSLDDFIFREGNPAPQFLKIDVEGAESAALRGAAQLLEKHRPAMMIELHNPTEDRAVGAILKDLNYQVFRIDDDSPVQNLTSGWPDRDGMWGTVYCAAAH
jgi:FkbM family methyltransferase